MSANARRQGQPPAAPETPTKQRDQGGAIDVTSLLKELQDELHLIVSPARPQDTPGNATLYTRIKFLFYQNKHSLDEAIAAFRNDLANGLSHLSSEERTDVLFERLFDPVWLSVERIKESPTRTAKLDFTSTPSSSRLGRSTIQRVDSKAGGESDSMPPSPLARKSVLNIADNLVGPASSSTTRNSSRSGGSFWSMDARANTSLANTSFSTTSEVATDYTKSTQSETFGSSFDPNFLESRLHTSPVKPSETTARSAKRRKSDEQTIIPCAPELGADENTDPDAKRKPHACHWSIGQLHCSGYGDKYAFEVDQNVPFIVSAERTRLRQDAELDEREMALATSHQAVKDILRRHGNTKFQQSPKEIWQPHSINKVDDHNVPSEFSLTGIISLNAKSDKRSLFQLKLNPSRRDAQTSRVQRHFGADRFMTLILPSLTKGLPSHICGENQIESLQTAFQDWLLEPKQFLGRTWCFHYKEELKQTRASKGAAKVDKDLQKDQEVHFFATEGAGISEPASIFDFLNWQIPFKENAQQPVCKVFARQALSVKKTTPTITFKPSQIRLIPDITANGEPEATEFDDPMFQDVGRYPRKTWKEDEVMTDGCARMSVGMLLDLFQEANITTRPSLVQGRINGSKGTWIASAHYETSNPDDLEKWIEIRPSQLKVFLRPEDRDDEQCEVDRWEFALVNCSKPAMPSDIHRDFIPILEDRHVPRTTILDIAREGVDTMVTELREAIQDPARFALWSRNNSGRADDYRQNDALGLPRDAGAKVQLLVNEMGYTPIDNHIVAETAENMSEWFLQKPRADLRFAFEQSTSVFGVADPYGVLEPGTIHFSPSQPSTTGDSRLKLGIFAGKNVLAGRDPTARGSDIQKVRCICDPRLAYLKDIVVMPSRGRIPLAARLQGGDYDGDTFWICANARLVAPFLNAPILEPVTLQALGIKQDTRRLCDIVEEQNFGPELHAKTFLRSVLPFFCRETMLGIVTNYYYDLSYDRNDLWDPDILLVADLHDMIIDADKNGYVFGMREFTRFRREHKLPLSLPKREYAANLKGANQSDEMQKGKTKTKLRDLVSHSPRNKAAYILDDILFNIINPVYREHLDWFNKDVLTPAKQVFRDLDLEYVLREFEEEALNDREFPIDVRKEIKALKDPLNDVYRKWHRMWDAHHKGSAADSVSLAALPGCVELYNAIQPINPSLREWRTKSGSTAPTKWECFKVAVLSREHYSTKKTFMFWVARDVVRYLKPLSEKGRRVTGRVSAITQPKKPKDWDRFNAMLAGEASGGDDFESSFDDELFDSVDLD